jgi:RHS repeat-associated protein
VTFSNGIVLTYGYDNDSRPISINYKLGTTEVAGITYQYDAAGRRTQFGGNIAATGFPSAVSSAVYDVNNELTNWNGTTVTYDNNGNILNDGTNAYTWNGRNQLITRASTSFQYDSFGRRTLNAAGKNLFYDGFDVAQELSGTTVTANRVVGGTDEFFGRTDSTGTYTPITDAMGSVLALANSSGTILTQYSYDPFGGTSTAGATNSNSSQYTGRENDNNGLYYYRARYYSPSLHRFVSQDPRGLAGGGANLYAYAGNSPTNLRDPSGQSPCVVGAAAGVIIYNGYQVWREVDAFMNGRKVPNAGWSGAWKILSGSAAAAAAGCGIAAAATGLAGAAEGAAETGVNDIDIGESEFDHTIDRHTLGGADSAGKSIFFGDASDVANAIQNSGLGDSEAIAQGNGNFAFVNYADTAVGTNQFGQATNVYTVVVDGDFNLVTAFPGFPGYY